MKKFELAWTKWLPGIKKKTQNFTEEMVHAEVNYKLGNASE